MNSPKPQPCHACGLDFIGTHCPKCGAERAAFTALKKISQPQLTPCPYVARRICDCGNRGLCLDAA